MPGFNAGLGRPAYAARLRPGNRGHSTAGGIPDRPPVAQAASGGMGTVGKVGIAAGILGALYLAWRLI